MSSLSAYPHQQLRYETVTPAFKLDSNYTRKQENKRYNDQLAPIPARKIKVNTAHAYYYLQLVDSTSVGTWNGIISGSNYNANPHGYVNDGTMAIKAARFQVNGADSIATYTVS